MANWTDMGHAMRRRMGIPSNHLESAGTKMKKDITPEQITSSGARDYMGMDATKFNNVSGTPSVGKLMPKKNTQAAEPMYGTKANRKNVLVGNAAASERMGASYKITAKYGAVTSPEAASTMANARTIPSVSGRQNPNFQGGMGDAY